ncbi:unnamed protein product [Thelazia callipaeda]|uniref:Peptidase_M10 domain-containing protein n=1 Tax=Thelazia callipaeda TaxID=103827 RepID=A0A158RD65_THECL|nr:unnamed protein product [Thelazia callipaeda]
MHLWENVIDVIFVERQYEKADIEVMFATFDHGDNYPFDGQGNELAHAFYPDDRIHYGQTHINDSDPWPMWKKLKLGLPQQESLIASHYQGFFDTVPKLSPTDISAIQSLYGSLQPRFLNIHASEKIGRKNFLIAVESASFGISLLGIQ